MERNREGRRANMVAAATNGLSRRRHRVGGSLRDSPEDDVPVELQETVRLRDRKKDRDRDRDRTHSKRKRNDRLIHGDESTEDESVNDDEEDDEDERMLPPNPATSAMYSSSSLPNHHNQHQNQHQHHQNPVQHRKSYPPVTSASPAVVSAKVFRPAQPWKAADEMIGVSVVVPRKARSASTKRAHECWNSNSGGGGVAGDQNHRQASTSPARPNLVSATSPSPVSPPSSSTISIKKKMKSNGSKHRPPPLKSSSKSSSSNQDEIEIEIAEVLYGMMRQPQGPSKQEIMETKFDSRELNKTTPTTGDAKSRVSSPISNSPSVAAPPHPGFLLSHNSSSSSAPVGPKRKRPRPVSYTDDGPAIFASRSNPLSITKTEMEQSAKIGTSSPNLEKNSGSVTGNGAVGYEFKNSQFSQASYESQPDSAVKAENRSASSDSMLLTEELEDALKEEDEEEAQSPKNEAHRNKFDENSEDFKTNFVKSGVEAKREEKIQIDLMAPPFQTRSSPEREAEIHFSIGPNSETERRLQGHEDVKTLKLGRDDNSRISEPVEKKEEVELQKTIVNKDRFIDLQLDLQRSENDNFSGNNKISQNAPKHHPLQQKIKSSRDEPANIEKTAQSSGSLPLSISMANWPGGLPPMGYMSPLQGVVSMDGTNVSSAALHQPQQVHFSQPRPKRCATHCYIARNIHCHQQYARMNSFWPAPAICKAANITGMPMASSEMLGNSQGRSVIPLPDNKGSSLAMFHGHPGKDNKGPSQAANIVDAAQRKQQQILLQQALPQGAPNNILHGPAFLFPLNQPQAVAAAAAAASVRPGSFKATITGSSVPPTVVSNSASLSGSATAAVGPTAMSFNYPNMPNNDTQYLVLQNNGYPFPMPTHVGGSPAAAAYRGTHAQAVPFFNGSFYSSQILHHPSQLQQQQQQQFQQHQQQQQQPQQPQTQHQSHQNASISSGSSSSQKQHLQNLQQQRPQGNNGSIINGGSFSATKSKPPSQQQLPPQQQQQQSQQRLQLPPHQARQLENEVGGEDSPSTADSRVSQSRPNMGVYGQNYAMPIHPQNFALLTHPVSMSGNGSGSNPGEKKQQQQPSPAFAMSFASFSDTSNSPGLDMSSMAQNQAILQNFPEAARHGYQQMMAAAHASQIGLQKKSIRSSEEAKTGGGDSSTNVEDERKKAQTPSGQSIAFSRSDLSETSGSTIPGSTVIDSSSRGLNHVSASSRASQQQPLNSSSSQQQQQLRLQQQQQHHLQHQQHQHQHQLQQQQQHMIQIQKQQAQYVARNKLPAPSSSASVYSDQVSVKFSNALSATFPQNLVQSSGSPSSQSSPQWKESARTNPSAQPASSSMAAASSTTSSLKNLPQQQQSRSQPPQQSHTQISFSATLKSSSTPPQPQQQPSNITNQAPSPPMAVGSPTTSSISNKGNSGSPRTATPTYTSIKPGQASSTLSPQQGKSTVSAPRKSSPVGGRAVLSILGNPHNNSSSSTGSKPQVMVQQHQNQLPKQAKQQAQLFFSNSYMQQTQGGPNSINTAYTQRRRPEQQQQQQQQTQGSSAAPSSSSGMLSLSQPATLPNGSSTSDPTKAVAAANAAAVNSNTKAGGSVPQSQSQSMRNAAQFAAASQHPVPPGFSYVHAVPTPVQVKPVEQKQPAGE